MTTLIVVTLYLVALLALGALSKRAFRGTSQDYFVASRSIGPFLLVMSLFGTTMTAFALVGSTAKAYTHGVGVYGLMASWAGITHSAVFFLVGIKLWRLGRRYGYVTQVEYFRDRFQSERLGTILFPVLVLLVIPYLLIGLLGAGITVEGVTRSAELFTGPGGEPRGVPPCASKGRRRDRRRRHRVVRVRHRTSKVGRGAIERDRHIVVALAAQNGMPPSSRPLSAAFAQDERL